MVWERPFCRLGLLVWLILSGLGLSVAETACAGDAAGGPVVQEIQIVGAVLSSPEKIRGRMRTRKGRPLDERVLKEDFNRIWKMGVFSDVQIHKDEAEGGVRLRVVVQEKSVVRRILFRGQKQASERTLTKLISTEIGAPYDPGVVNRDVRAIQKWYHDEHYYFTEVSHRTEPFEDGIRLTYVIRERGRVAVKDVVFHGNEKIGRKELLQHMTTRPSSFFSRGKFDRQAFEQDLERLRLLYQDKGHLDATVEERPFQITGDTADSKWRTQEMYVHIDINEGPVYYVGEIRFDVKPAGKAACFSDERMRAVLEVMPGDPYSPIIVNGDASRIHDLYSEQGRIFSKVRPQRILPPEGTVVDVVFNVQEGAPVVVDDVLITGNTKTQERVIRREIELYPGEVVDGAKLKESERNLNRLNFFERPISIDVKEGSSPDRAKVVVAVKERRTGQLSLGLGVSSASGLVGSASLKQRNFDHRKHPKNMRELLSGKAYTGAGELFSANFSSGSETQDYSIDFMNPWIFNRPVRLGLGGFYRNREWSTHDELRTGFYVLLGRKIFGKHWDISARYRLEEVDINDVDADASPFLRNEEGDNWISRVAMTLAYDTRDDIFSPSEGWYGKLTEEIAGGPLGGTKDFWRTYGEVNYWWKLFEDKQKRPHVVSFRMDGAVTDAYGDDDEVPFYERWYAGGIGSIRGFDFHSVAPQDIEGDPIGGEVMASASVEYFFPILEETIRGSVFYDIGNVWGDYEEWDGDGYRSSTGVGVHLRTPLGPMPIRIYYTIPLKKEDQDDTATVQFTFGAYF